jgi:hypothetical protein
VRFSETPLPEPTSFLLLSIGLVGIGIAQRLSKKRTTV